MNKLVSKALGILCHRCVLLCLITFSVLPVNAEITQKSVEQPTGNIDVASLKRFFDAEKLTNNDAVLVVGAQDQTLYQWQPDRAMIPASLTKLVTAQLAIDKWGLEHTFYTDFFRYQDQLWVKGYGDPYLVSEEIDRMAQRLNKADLTWVKSLHVDASFFSGEVVPGRSGVNDPYNAPLSAVSANFNTTSLRKSNGVIESGEPQTPLTPLAKRLGRQSKSLVNNKSVRINLINGHNAQRNMAQLLLSKLGNKTWPILIDQVLPQAEKKHLESVDIEAGDAPQLLLRYYNTHQLKDIVRGMLSYSNNFMANQLFLMLSDPLQGTKRSFLTAQQYAENVFSNTYSWQHHVLLEGSGLSRQNKLSAQQIDQLLVLLSLNKTLFKKIAHPKADIYAKTGTLDGVRSFAGFIKHKDHEYRFVFMFNRTVPWRYREQLLARLVDHLAKQNQLHRVLSSVHSSARVVQ